MKLCRIETKDGIKPAVMDADGKLRDLSGHISDVTAETLAPEALATHQADRDAFVAHLLSPLLGKASSLGVQR